MATKRAIRRLGAPADDPRRLRDLIRSRIHHGEFAGGELPSETEMMVRFGASRSVVREALDLLRSEGLISRVQGVGTFVLSTPTPRQLLEMRCQISELFHHFDLLITPTTPNLPFQLLNRKGTLEERLARTGMAAVMNTSPLDLTGHPAMTVPNGTGPDDLPVGLQVIGPHFGEAVIYQAAFAFEAA